MEENYSDRRKSPRSTYRTKIQCLQCIADGKIIKYDPPLEIQVVNISSEGLCISASELYKEGTVLEFDIILEDTLYKSISATIIWGVKNRDKYNYGLHINNITGKFGVHINKMENRLSTRV